LRVLYFSFAVVVVDQITKLLVKGFSIPFLNFTYDGMYYGQVIPVIGDFFRLTFIENPGMAFGYDPGDGLKFWVTLFSLVASIGLIIYLYFIREKSLSLRIAIALILGGAIGNLIDRLLYGVIFGYAPLFYGKVVDFLDFDFFNFTLFGRTYDRWPIFNIADAAVSIGVLVLIIFYRKHQKEEEEASAAKSADNLETDSETAESSLIGKSDIAEVKSDNVTDEESDSGKKIQD
jgi:signal peptidase II